jgi:hypothetical protein
MIREADKRVPDEGRVIQNRPMTNLRRMMVLGLCMGLICIWLAGILSGGDGSIGALDFASVYYQARCALQHKDAYNPQTVLQEFKNDGQEFPGSPSGGIGWTSRLVVTTAVYPPTGLLVMAPLAMLRWPIALKVWRGLICSTLVLAAFLMWDLAEDSALPTGWLLGFMMLNSLLVLWFANPAGVLVPLCAIAAWCFLKERFALAGVAVLAVCLVTKPHDAGFVWLYFLLAGGTGRKRAWQTLAAVAVLSVCATVWIAGCSPGWVGELRSHLRMEQSRGNVEDPGPHSAIERSSGPNISLQNTVSVFRDDPHFYIPVTYAVCGSLLLVWVVAVLRKRTTREGSLLALAAISALTLLPVYHLPYDAKLLLLAVPGCAVLWARGGKIRWVAFGLSSAAIFATSDIPLSLWAAVINNVRPSTSGPGGTVMLLLLQPVPLVLLATGCFYLWVYVRYEPAAASLTELERAKMKSSV